MWDESKVLYNFFQEDNRYQGLKNTLHILGVVYC